jgi:beta-1,4-mannosyl-glycoprotein beta-1,4-N-acetylglucosaminyltransferase
LKIFDCVPFYNETGLLRLRIACLEDLVDRFVVVEARQTHAGQPKPLHLWADEAADLRAHPKLVARAVDLPADADDWGRDYHQRDRLGDALAELGAAPGDVILHSDVDEIPARAAVQRAAEALAAARERMFLAFEQRLFHFRLNYELVWSRKLPWLGTAAARFGDLRTMTGLRATARRQRGRHARGLDASARVFALADAGWHFSYLGGDDALERKLAAHAEHRQKARHGGGVQAVIDARASLYPRAGLDEVWAVVPPSDLGLPARAVERAALESLIEPRSDSTADILRRVRKCALPRRGRIWGFDVGFARRGPWPPLQGY